MNAHFHFGTALLCSARAHGRFIVALGLVLGCSAGMATALASHDWRIDEAHTSIGFKIDAVGFPTTRGQFTHYNGRILIDFDHPARSFTNFVVESASIDLGSPSFNDFVRSPALLDVAKYPMLSFNSTQVEKVDARTARITGDLSMLGVTRPITLNVTVDPDPGARGRVVAFLATGTIKRSDYGMVFGIPLIDDALEITVRTRALTNE